MTGPLDGIRVVDFSRVLAGPLCTMYLGDLGAEVVKVERPGSGDDTRGWTPPVTAEGRSTYYLAVNRNKASVEVDLSSPAGLADAERLIAGADVVVDNFRAGTWDRFGLTPERVAALNPRLVHASISGFGPGTDLPGYDLLAQAASGLMSITGDPDGPPTKVGVAIVDVLAGLNTAVGILAALHERDRTGLGQRLAVDLLGSALAGLVNQASAVLNAGAEPRRMGNRHPSIVPYEPVETADGWLALAVGTDAQFRDLCHAIGRAELAADPRFATNPDRVANRDALMGTLGATFRERSAGDWLAVLRDADVPAAPVLDIAGALAFAEDLGGDPVVELEHADGSRSRSIRNPIRMADGRVSYRLAPPDLGEHGGAGAL